MDWIKKAARILAVFMIFSMFAEQTMQAYRYYAGYSCCYGRYPFRRYRHYRRPYYGYGYRYYGGLAPRFGVQFYPRRYRRRSLERAYEKGRRDEQRAITQEQELQAGRRQLTQPYNPNYPRPIE